MWGVHSDCWDCNDPAQVMCLPGSCPATNRRCGVLALLRQLRNASSNCPFALPKRVWPYQQQLPQDAAAEVKLPLPRAGVCYCACAGGRAVGERAATAAAQPSGRHLA